jgi:hypothetical protein
MTPRRAAWATASVRPTASSLSRSEATWNLAVWTEMPSRRAITLFDAPSASSARTSSSRGVSGTSASADAETSVEGTTAASAASVAPTSRNPGTPASRAASRSASAGSYGRRRMTSTRRRGSNTALPIARPAGSMASPPSALRRKRRSSSIRASISPPRKERQGPSERYNTPSAAVGVAAAMSSLPQDCPGVLSS